MKRRPAPSAGAQSWVKATHQMFVVELRRVAVITLPIGIIMLVHLE